MLRLLVIFLLSSCLASTQGDYQQIKIISKETKNMRLINGIFCEVRENNKLLYSGVTPFSINLKRSDYKLPSKENEPDHNPLLICFHHNYTIPTIKSSKSIENDKFEKRLEAKRDKIFYDNLTNPITLLPGLVDITLGTDKSYPQIITIFIDKEAKNKF